MKKKYPKKKEEEKEKQTKFSLIRTIRLVFTFFSLAKTTEMFMFLSQSVQIGQSHKYLTAMNYLFSALFERQMFLSICGENSTKI